MSKPNILFVSEHNCDGNHRLPISTHFYNLFWPLDNSGLAQRSNLFIDSYWREQYKHIDQGIYDYVNSNSVDIVAFCYLGDSLLNPSDNLIDYLHKNHSCKIIFFWPDTVYEFAQKKISRFPYATHFALDNVDQRCIHLWVAQDENLFFPQDKGLDIVFMGTRYGKRQEYLDYLHNHNLPVYEGYGQRTKPLTLHQYAESLSKAKLSIHFSWSMLGGHQFKGRVTESIASQCLLLETENDITPRYFEPYKEYVPFTTPQDLLEKATHFLHHADEAEKIAKAGYLRYMAEYNNNVYWKKILGCLRE